MKKLTISLIIALLFVAGISYAQMGGGISPANYWMFDGTHILPSDATWEVGSSAARIIKGWFTDIDVTNISIGGISTGDIDMDGNLILNIGTSTTDFTSGGGLDLAGDFNSNATSTIAKLIVTGESTLATTTATHFTVSGDSSLATTGITDLTVSGDSILATTTINNTFTIGSLSGVLQAVAGIVSGSSTMDNILDGATYVRSHNDFTDTYKGYLNQNVTTTGTPTFSTINELTLASTTTGFTIAGGSTSKTLTLNDNITAADIVDAYTAPLSVSSGNISIPVASSTADGYLSSTDWSTFNAKQDSLSIGNLTEATSSIFTITGGTGAVIGSGTTIEAKAATSTQSGYLTSADWSVFYGKASTGESTTVSSPLVLTTYDISIPAATSTTNGYLTSSDWSVFYGKQAGDATLTALAGLTIGANELIYGTGADAFSMLGVNATSTNKFLRQISSGVPSWETLVAGDIPDISGTYQSLDASLTSIAGLTYASDSFIKLTAEDVYGVRTLAETKTDLSLNLVENTALSSWAGTTNITTLGTIATGTWNGVDIAVADGGTGKSSWTQYLIPFATTTTEFAQIPIGTDGQVLTSGGAGVAPGFEDIFDINYAEMYQTDNATSTAITTVNVWEEVDNFVSGSLSNWTHTTGDLTASTGSAGLYSVMGSISSAVAVANKDIEFAVSINNAIQTKCKSKRRYASSDTGSQSISCILTIADADVVKLEVRNTTDDVNITVMDANISLSRL